MTDNGAAQARSWPERGQRATAALRGTWESLAEVCHELATTEWELPTGCPGWSVKDQLSHIIGIERSLMGEAAPEWDGPVGDHVKNEFAVGIEKWVAVRRALPGPEVQAELVEVTGRRLAQLASVTDEGWAEVGPGPLGVMPYADLMDLRVYDCWVHEQDVRVALDRPGGDGGGASSISLNRVQAAMGFVVGKQAACPDGTCVTFDVSGRADDARRFSVAVEGGRARPVAEPATPTVTLRLSSIDFVRLGCGRATADEVGAAGGIGLEGDPALGKHIADHMNFMF